MLIFGPLGLNFKMCGQEMKFWKEQMKQPFFPQYFYWLSIPIETAFWKKKMAQDSFIGKFYEYSLSGYFT